MNQSLTVTTIHEQQFPLPYYRVTGELLSVASAAHTTEPEVPEVPSEMSPPNFVSYVR
jgi:hypothetical protein